jgi:hypothetical protein
MEKFFQLPADPGFLGTPGIVGTLYSVGISGKPKELIQNGIEDSIEGGF